MSVIEAQNIKIYQPPIEEDDEAAAQHARSLMAAMPFAVIGSEKDVKTSDGRIVKGRQYSWGVAEGKILECNSQSINDFFFAKQAGMLMMCLFSFFYSCTLFLPSSRERGPL